MLMIAVLVLGSAYSERSDERHDEAIEATTLAMLSAAVAKVGDSGKFHERLLVEEIVETNETIGYVIVSDANGRIRSHSDSSRNGTQLEGTQLATVTRALSAASPIFETIGSENGRIKQIASAYSGGFNDETPGVIFLGLSRTAADSQRESARLFFGALVIILALLAGVAVFVISRLYGRSIRSMADQLDALLQHTPLLIRIDGTNGELIACSDAYAEATKIDEDLRDAMKSTDVKVRLWKSSNGSRFSLTSFRMHRQGKGIQTCTVGLDISKQSIAEEALRDNEERLRITLNSIGDAVIATDALMRVERMNPLAEELTQWKLADALGKPLSEVFDTADAAHEIVDPESATHKFLRRRDGSEIRIEGSSSAMLDPSKKRTGDVIVFRDVTRRHRDEVRLWQADKEDSIGQLAGGVAHDFNNMLTGILGASQLIARQLQAEHSKRNYEHINEYVELIDATSMRAGKLTEQLLMFSRKGSATAVAVPVHELIEQTVALLRRSIDKRIQIETKLEASLSIISADPTRVQMAFLNLGINARDAMADAGTLRISTKQVHLSTEDCERFEDPVRAGAYVQVEFRDTGCGMSEELQKRIFEPYYTTKDVGKGTGLGLASVHGAVRGSRGAITLESTLGVGTAFRIFLPLTEAKIVETTATPIQTSVKESRNILVVEDESAVRLTAVRILQSMGYHVIEAVDGQEAVDLVEAKASSIDVVLTDMLMPRMNGRDAFYAIRKLEPKMPIVAVSGYTSDVDIEQLERDGLAGYLRKPYLQDELANAIERALRPHSN